MIGKIYKILSDFYYVKNEENIYECRAQGKLKDGKKGLTVGDNVEFEIDKFNKNKANIIKKMERKNYIVRPSVANIDKMLIVISIKDPMPDMMLVDKQIIYALINNIKPVICITKIDKDENEDYKTIKKTYEEIGYKVYPISSKEKIGLDELKNELKNCMCVLSGNSGVGKSSLINAICGKNVMKEGKISTKIARGKHTTRHTEIFKYDDFEIIDTPGFSVFDVLDITYKELYNYYEEFGQFIEKCEYRDCTHVKEQTCGIKEAVSGGKIDKR